MEKEKQDDSAFILNLIENVKNNKCLYKKGNPFYFNKKVRERAWKDIGEICSKSGADCKHRWKLLRERFTKELKRMETPGNRKRHQDEWYFLQPMMFLKYDLAPRRTRDNVEEQETEKVLDQPIFKVESLLEPQTPSPIPPKKCKNSLDSLCQKFGQTIQNIEKNFAAPLEQETADEIFMKTVLCLMKELPADIKDDFQAGIMQELYRLRKMCRNINV